MVVELGGVSRAADHLIVAQPVVTAHVQSLQRRLGVKLLYRDGHRMRLTDEGERVYSWASETLSRTRELARDLDGLSEGQRGAAAVAASMTIGSYLLPPILIQFRQRRPAAAITLLVSDPEHAMTAVELGECDFAVVVADALPNNPGLRIEPIGHEEIVLVAAPDYDPGVVSLEVAALEDAALISSPAGLVRRGVVDARLAACGVRPRNIVIELGHPEAMKRATQDGLGMCLMFRASVTQELLEGKLREIPLRDTELSVPLIAVLRSDKRPSPIQRDLLDAVCVGVARLAMVRPGSPAR